MSHESVQSYRLHKTGEPDVLVHNGGQWKDELLAVLAADEKPSQGMRDRYRHPQIKDAVVVETHGKCAYCESKIRHTSPGDIEHIVPKSKVPAKAYLWENLTLACGVCNNNKGDIYTEDPQLCQDQLIDPYVDDPADHFLFLREVVTPRPDSMRALATETVIKLKRSELHERRRERMDFIDGLVRAYSLADARFKPLLLTDLYENHLQESDEYYASSVAYVNNLKAQGVIK